MAGKDKAFWVSLEVFEAQFDLGEYNEFRDVRVVERNYAKQWFYLDQSGILRFSLPVIDYYNGSTEFINGRHRTAVLFNELDRIPMALSQRATKVLLSRSALTPLRENEQFILPDLPKVDRPNNV
ncbi:MAG: hypothetical protein AB2736_11040 [Candidatus Thiodiazotropha taylori]